MLVESYSIFTASMNISRQSSTNISRADEPLKRRNDAITKFEFLGNFYLPFHNLKKLALDKQTFLFYSFSHAI